MTTVQISYDVTDEAEQRVRAMLDEKALRDVAWNGAEFSIERADHTCIPDDESPNAIRLLESIYDAIDGRA